MGGLFTMSVPNYTPSEAMVIYGARCLKQMNGRIGLMGVGLPFLVYRLAKELYEVNITILIEEGEFDSDVRDVPLTTCDNRLVYGASLATDTRTALTRLSRNKVDFGFIGGAQIDKFGNVNSTVIGDYDKPANRLAGSGGAVDIAGFCQSIIMMGHEKRRIVERVDYITSPGWVVKEWVNGVEREIRREELGLTGGPVTVITNRAIMLFDDRTKEMYVKTYFPGVTPQEIAENTGFAIDLSRAEKGEPILKEEVAVLRESVDPANIYKTRPSEN
jgi:glutaconate CoA-transferase, subunit B